MGSYELMELLEFMPDDGAFKTAARGGEFTERDQVWRHIATELAKLRATTHAVYGGKQYSPKVFYTMAELQEMIQESEEAEERREEFFQFADRTPKMIEA